MAKSTKQPEVVESIEYISKQEAHVHRKNKTTVVEAACTTIVSRHGTVTADLLVQEATDPNHPLHEFFVWDDKVAGVKYRRAQAVAMIIATKYVAYLHKNQKKAKNAISEAEKAVQVRRFLPSHDGTGFRDRKDILDDDASRKAVIERKVGALRAWCKSVVDISELMPLRLAVAKAIESL